MSADEVFAGGHDVAVLPARPGVSLRFLTALSVTAVTAAGASLLAFAYHQASAGGRPFALVWAATALLLVPAALLLGAARTSPATRLFALGLLSGVSAVPKVLRSPSRPVFSDEFAHLREVVNLVEGWGLFESNALVRMASEFPGMHATVAAVAETLRMPVWPVAQATVAFTHLLLVWAVFALVAQFASLRASAVATLVYVTNPSFLLFNMQVAYESFALPLAMWSLAATVAALRAPSGWARRGLWSSAVVLAAAVAVAHHLSALGLLVALTLVAVGVWRRDGWVTAAAPAALTAALAAGFAAWVAAGQVALGGYLAP
jgi:hypothetical protein